ncbi:hypothetical protein TNCV_560341 [Trichonephila clavipes]|nr:hypothetical protein TNCV_560341 [Trichonephila clavipes]
MVNIPWRDTEFTNSIGVSKRAENPWSTKNALDDLRLHGTRKMLRLCLNVYKKIVTKYMNKSLTLYTSRRRHLTESLRCKKPQFLQSVMNDIFCMTMHQHIDPTW